MPMVLSLFLIISAQPIFGPITKCPVVVEVVDMAWAPVGAGVEVVVRDDRTMAKQTKLTDENGRTSFTVDSCDDDRCRFTVSAGRDSSFKTVTLKRLWFGAYQNVDRRVQIRMKELAGGVITIR